jgi:DNA processing protein
MALEQGRDVMAVPGAVVDARHAGCHRLIKQGAGLIDSATDLFEAFGISPPDLQQRPELGPMLERVLGAVGSVPTALHAIVESLGMSTEETLSALTELELARFVEPHRGGYIRRPNTTMGRK